MECNWNRKKKNYTETQRINTYKILIDNHNAPTTAAITNTKHRGNGPAFSIILAPTARGQLLLTVPKSYRRDNK